MYTTAGERQITKGAKNRDSVVGTGDGVGQKREGGRERLGWGESAVTLGRGLRGDGTRVGGREDGREGH